jgi:hypothetical protein
MSAFRRKLVVIDAKVRPILWPTVAREDATLELFTANPARLAARGLTTDLFRRDRIVEPEQAARDW